MRTVVVGASSGLGRCIGVGLAQRGDEVALLARRRERLESAAAEAGEHAHVVECDVTDDASVKAAIEEAAAVLGGIDGLVYAPAIGPLAKLTDIDGDTWAQVFATNVTGAALVTAAAMPHLEEAQGTVIFLSSVIASLTPPWPALGAYAVSKAALDKLVEAWRMEHPSVGFTRLVVGDCAGGEGEGRTEFNEGWDMELAGEVVPVWFQRNYLSGSLLDVEEVIAVAHTVLSAGSTVAVPTVTLAPRVSPMPEELAEQLGEMAGEGT